MVALESYPGIAAIRYHLISTWLSLPGSEAAWAEFLRSTHACRSNTIAGVMTGFVPLSKLMAEPIEGLRRWAKGRAKYATTQQQESKLRKLL